MFVGHVGYRLTSKIMYITALENINNEWYMVNDNGDKKKIYPTVNVREIPYPKGEEE